MTDINITSQKQAFLISQIRLLSTPLTTPTSNINIPPMTLDPLLAKLNKQITSHNRLVFGLQSQRHVAEQIDSLYWQDVLRDGLPVYNATDSERTVIKRDMDLTNTREVEQHLSEEWDDVCLRPFPPSKRRKLSGVVDEEHEEAYEAELHADNSTEEHEGEYEDADGNKGEEEDLERAQRYAVLHGKLVMQARQRDELRRKLARYKKLGELLRPLENATENVQPNLVTRHNKEIEVELARMRVLLARAGNAAQTLTNGERPRRKEEESPLETPEERLESLLALG